MGLKDAKPGDLIVYGYDYGDIVSIGCLVSVSAKMFRVHPWDRPRRVRWHGVDEKWGWEKPISMGKAKYRRRIPAEVWQNDDAFVEKLNKTLRTLSGDYDRALQQLREHYRADRDAILKKAGALPDDR